MGSFLTFRVFVFESIPAAAAPLVRSCPPKAGDNGTTRIAEQVMIVGHCTNRAAPNSNLQSVPNPMNRSVFDQINIG